MDKIQEFHNSWQAKNVKVKSGAFADRVGLVQSTRRPYAEVVMPSDNGVFKLWILVDDLEVIQSGSSDG